MKSTLNRSSVFVLFGERLTWSFLCVKYQKKLARKTKSFYMVFIDLKKAFDTVNRAALWKILKKLGIPDIMLNVIKSFHKGMRASVVSNGNSSEQFGKTNGTKQGSQRFFLLSSSLLCWNMHLQMLILKVQLRTTSGIFKDFELNFHDRDVWKSICHQRIKWFSAACIQKLKQLEQKQTQIYQQLCLSIHTHVSTVQISLAGLKCHLRLNKCRQKQQWTEIIFRISYVKIDGRIHHI